MLLRLRNTVHAGIGAERGRPAGGPGGDGGCLDQRRKQQEKMSETGNILVPLQRGKGSVLIER